MIGQRESSQGQNIISYFVKSLSTLLDLLRLLEILFENGGLTYQLQANYFQYLDSGPYDRHFRIILGLNIVFRFRDDHHLIHCEVLFQNGSLTF